MASFNKSLKNFNNKYYRALLKISLWKHWTEYQNLRFKESYLPAFKKFKLSRKSFLVIIGEVIKVTFIFRCLPYHYFRYGLYRSKFTFDKILKFYPETLFYYKDLPKINTNYVLLDDKIIFESIIRGSGLKFPETVLKRKNGCVYDSLDNLIDTSKKFDNILLRVLGDTVFVKPANYSSGGEGIFVLRKKEDVWLMDNGALFSFAYISKEIKGDWILQKKVENCKQIASIHDKSVNSFRILTVFKPGVGPKVVYISLKFGTNNSYTDNAHTGGLYVGVDQETGQFSSVGFDEDLNEYDKHPLHKTLFKDIKIDDIQTVTECANKVAHLFSDLSVVGWDIVLSDDGPYILEGNSSSGLTIFQRPFNGLKKLMSEIKPLL